MNKKYLKEQKSIKEVRDAVIHNIIANVNNTALSQQKKGEITTYLISTQVNLSREEIEEILKKLRKK